MQDQAQGAIVPARAHGREMLTCVCGLGVINASLALGAALAQGNINGVVNAGVAGSFDLHAHPVGAVRLVDQEIWPEYGLLATGQCCADAAALGFALGRAGEMDVRDRLAWDATAALARLGLCPGPWATATSLTVSGVTADSERAELLRGRYQAGLENMEGFALAYGCALAGVPFVELRAVSNAVGARPPRTWDLPGALAALGQAAERLLTPGRGN